MRMLRFLAPAIFVVALFVHQTLDSSWVDLFLFNAIPILCLISILMAPGRKNKWAQPLTALDIGSWSLGSLAATASSYA